MADNSAPVKSLRKRLAAWWIGGAIVLIPLVWGAVWLERKGTLSPPLQKWLPRPDWLVYLALVAGGILALAILWKGPQWQVRRIEGLNAKDRFDSVNEARKTMATILGGAAILAGLLGTWLNIKLAQEGMNVTQKNLAVSIQGQMADRFSKAIEQLGAKDGTCKKLEVRLGGIYSLGRIADESAAYHQAVLDVLSTYVRVNDPKTGKSTPQKLTSGCPTTGAFPYPHTDIQAILLVLGGPRNRSQDKGHLDFSDTDLRSADLYRAKFRNANFYGVDLGPAKVGDEERPAVLIEADFGGANFNDADLTDAAAAGADFSGASLNTNLSGTDLNGACLSGADLSDALNLSQRQIDEAKGDSSTKLPAGLLMPRAWKQTPCPVPTRNKQ